MQREKLFPLGLAYNLAFIIGISIRALILICNSNRMIAPHNILARHTKAVLICGTVNKLLTCCDLDSEHQELFIFLTKCWWMAHILLPLYDIVSFMFYCCDVFFWSTWHMLWKKRLGVLTKVCLLMVVSFYCRIKMARPLLRIARNVMHDRKEKSEKPNTDFFFCG